MKKFTTKTFVLVCMLLTASIAWAENFNVWVSGVRVTSANTNDVLNDNTVSWDNSTNTLTLRNASINNNATMAAILIGDSTYSDTSLNATTITIQLVGNNTINAPLHPCIAIYGTDTKVNINNMDSVAHLSLVGNSGIRCYGNGNNKTVFLNQGNPNAAFTITTNDSAIATDNLIIAKMYGTNNKIEVTANNGTAIACNELYTGNQATDLFTTPCGVNHDKYLQIIGRVNINNNRINLNKQARGNNYLQTPTTAAIVNGFVYDVTTATVANNVVINHSGTRYHIWVKGVEVTSHNAQNILGNNTASYVAATGTLVLNNFAIDTTEQFYMYHLNESPNNLSYIYFDAQANNTRRIELQGQNIINVKENVEGKKPYLVETDGDADLAFVGDGMMHIKYHSTTNSCVLHSSNNDMLFLFNGTGHIEANTNIANSLSDKQNIKVSYSNYQTYWHNDTTTPQATCTFVNTSTVLNGNNIHIIYMEPVYDLYVADVRIDLFNANDIAAMSNVITGTVTYNHTSKTLSLNNATINYNGSNRKNNVCVIKNYGVFSDNTLNVHLEGDNQLSLTKNGTSSRLYGFLFGATFTGPGNMNLSLYNQDTTSATPDPSARLGLCHGLSGTTKFEGTGNITITTPNYGYNLAIKDTVITADNYTMYSGATADSATLQEPKPIVNVDKYLRLEYTADPLVFTDTTAMDIPTSTVGIAITAIDCSPYVTGGIAPYSFAAIGLPDGLTIATTTGIISGTPTTAAAANTAVIIVTDAHNDSATVTIAYGTIIAPLVFTDTTAMDIPATVVGTTIDTIDCSPYVTGGVAPYNFTATGLPDGLTIDTATGVIAGTPTTAAAADTAVITVTDANNDSASVTIAYGEITTAVVAIETIQGNSLIVWSREGYIGCSADNYTIYTIQGVEVTCRNGQLTSGSYIVRTTEGVAKITIK